MLSGFVLEDFSRLSEHWTKTSRKYFMNIFQWNNKMRMDQTEPCGKFAESQETKERKTTCDPKLCCFITE